MGERHARGLLEEYAACYLLYFVHGRAVAVLAHAVTKEDVIRDADFSRALRRKQEFESDTDAHTYRETP
jgi:hypothetical protein